MGGGGGESVGGFEDSETTRERVTKERDKEGGGEGREKRGLRRRRVGGEEERDRAERREARNGQRREEVGSSEKFVVSMFAVLQYCNTSAMVLEYTW